MTSMAPRFTAPLLGVLLGWAGFVGPSWGAIFNWQTGQVIPGTEAIAPGPGIDLSDWNTPGHTLEFAGLDSRDLSSASFDRSNLTNADLSQANLAYARFEDANLTSADLSQAALENAYFWRANLSDANFNQANLTNAFLVNSNLTNASLIQANLTNANLFFADLSNANLSSANLTDANLGGRLAGANFANAWVQGTNFSGASFFTAVQLYSTASYQAKDLTGIHLGSNLSGWNFASQNLTGAGFSEANLTSANLIHANLTNANFYRTTLTNANFTGAIVKGAYFRSSFLPAATGLTASQLYSTASYADGDLSGIGLWDLNLTGWNFANQNLTGASLGESNLTNASLAGANLTDAYLGSSTLTNANFTHSNLTGAYLGQSNLTNADFTHANLTGASLGGLSAGATITNANFTGATIKGADFSWSIGFTASQLTSTASYADGDLVGIRLPLGINLTGVNLANQNLFGASFWESTLTDAHFTNANLTGASLNYSTLTDANFTGAVIKEVDVGGAIGFAVAQLYSTASYADGDLSGIRLRGVNLPGVNFANQNLASAWFGGSDLTNANFTNANLRDASFGDASFGSSILTNANFTGADLRGAPNWFPAASTVTHNAIQPSGAILGLDLRAGEKLVVRNYASFGLTVHDSAAFDPASTLQFLLASEWASPVGFFSVGPEVALAGTLDLAFAAGVNPLSLLGQTFKLFDWTGATPTGAFIVSSPYAWDLSKLYTTGEVTLLPEPGSLVVCMVLGWTAFQTRHRVRSNQRRNNGPT